MLAAALTIWLMFSLWMIAPFIRAPGAIATTAMALAVAELVALLVWSYSDTCEGAACTGLAQAAGAAARTDIPILAALFVVLALVRLRAARALTPVRPRRAARRSAHRPGGGRPRPAAGGTWRGAARRPAPASRCPAGRGRRAAPGSC